MNIVLAIQRLNRPGGCETYTLTVSEQLRRLGHEVVILTRETGPMAEFIRERGIRVVTEISALDGWGMDSAIVQEGALSYHVAERFPEMPQLFRGGGDLFDMGLPPGLPGVVSSVVVLNDRLHRRISAMATDFQVHRLRQPVDTKRFVPVGPSPDRPRRALVLGNYLRGERFELLRRVLGESGIAVTRVGGERFTCEPERRIWEADFVVGLARAAVEAMACGKPVLLYDRWGCDGWVTPERYPAMEADNFAGQSSSAAADPGWLREELGNYRPEMGVANRELAITHHSAQAHTQQLCAILESAPRPRDLEGAPLRELSRLVEMQWVTELRAENLRQTADQVYAELQADRALLSSRRVRAALRAGRMLDTLRRRGPEP